MGASLPQTRKVVRPLRFPNNAVARRWSASSLAHLKPYSPPRLWQLRSDMADMSLQPSNAGIVTNDDNGERQIPESVRADGSTRKAIKIRPGYRPPEDVEVYKNRPAEAFRERGKKIGIPGTAGLKDEQPEPASAASTKNAKRREARKRAKASEGGEGVKSSGPNQAGAQQTATPVDPEVDREKKARTLKKKLKQARELQSKKEGGEALLPEQIAKVIKINELIRELDALGFSTNGEPRPDTRDDRGTDDCTNKG